MLYPTPALVQVLDTTLVASVVTLYNVACGERARRPPGEKRRVSLNYYQQADRIARSERRLPEYAEVNAQVLQDALRRLDHAFKPSSAV